MDGKVLYITRYVPAYRIPMLNQLFDALDGNLVVCAGRPPGTSSALRADQEQEERYSRIHLANHFWRGESIHYQSYGPAFREHPRPAVILAEESPRSITLPFLLREARLRGAGRVLWGIFYSVFRPFSPTHPLQAYRLRMANSVEACACYTRGVRDILEPHVDPSKLFVAQNTLDTRTLFKLQAALQAEGRNAVRQRLGLGQDRVVLVFVGQLIPRKGTRELLEIVRRLQSDRKVTMLVIGGGPEKAVMQDYVTSNQLEDVRFLGSMPLLESSAPYIFAADAMVIPGYVGLAANHSLCLGVPLVTQAAPGNIPFHGPEVESIVNGENGFITERNLRSLEEGIREVISERVRFSENALNYAKQHLTSEKMVQGLVGAIGKAWESRRLSGAGE